MGALSKRHGTLDIPKRAYLSDDTISLQGTHSVIGRYVVVYQSGSTTAPFACGAIREVKPQVVTANFFKKNVYGRVIMRQDAPDEPTRVHVELSGMDDVTGWEVTGTHPVIKADDGRSLQWDCVGGLAPTLWAFNPLNPTATRDGLNSDDLRYLVPTTSSPCDATVAEKSMDDCRLGSLQGALGRVGGSNTVLKMYEHSNLPLFGPYSITDHGLLLTTKTAQGADAPLTCAPLATDKPLFRAKATFVLPTDNDVYDGAVYGEVTLTQELGSPQAPTTLDVRVAYTCTREGTVTKGPGN